MKILSVTLNNFQSYDHLEFKYSDQGPLLISGPTKSGKSTILDGPAWVIFGTTSKDSAANDVRSWFSDDVTYGHAIIKTGNRIINVHRKRGKKPTDNDLWYDDGGDEKLRGKDASETQKLIERELGVTAQLYFSGSYIHQFSKSDTFFVAQAKYRREIIESIQDLSEPIKFADKCVKLKKEIINSITKLSLDRSNLDGKLLTLRRQLQFSTQESKQFDTDKLNKINELKIKSDSFESDKNEKISKIVDKLEALDQMIKDDKDFKKQLDALAQQITAAQAIEKEVGSLNIKLSSISADLRNSDQELERLSKLKSVCPTCLGPSENSASKDRKQELSRIVSGLSKEKQQITKLLEVKSKVIEQSDKLKDSHVKITKARMNNSKLVDEFDRLKSEALVLKNSHNRFDTEIEMVEDLKNTHEESIAFLDEEIKKISELVLLSISEDEELNKRKAAIEWLYDASFRAKAEMLSNSITRIESRTNEILETYFDGAIKVKMSMEDGDKVEVEIQNDGYDCPFKQLSGGERCMLKLAFNVAYMETAQDSAGVHIDTVMLDEAFNGLDVDLKVKAYNLIEHLSEKYSSVIVVEHSEEFKVMFPNVFRVTKNGSVSSIDELST